MVAPLEMFSWSSVLIWNEGRMPNNFLGEAKLDFHFNGMFGF